MSFTQQQFLEIYNQNSDDNADVELEFISDPDDIFEEKPEAISDTSSVNKTDNTQVLTQIFNESELALASFNARNIDIKEFKRKTLTYSFTNACFRHPLDYYRDATHLGKTVGLISGAVIGGVFGGPFGAMGGLCAGYAAGGVIAGAIRGGYDGAIKGGFTGAMQGIYDGVVIGCKHVGGYYGDEDKTPTNTLNQELHHFLVNNFPTPAEYKNTVDTGLTIGATIGAVLGLGLGSEIGGRCGSMIAGVIQGGYDGFLKGGFQGVFEGIQYGAAVGYYNYERQYKETTPLGKYIAESTEACLQNMIIIENYIVESVNAMLDYARKAYQNFNLFSPSTQESSGKFEFYLAENPRVIEEEPQTQFSP